jgi:hypothetical protein
MNRRQYLAVLGAGTLTGLAGCEMQPLGGDQDTPTEGATSGIYRPTHRDEMQMLGRTSGSSDRLRVALSATIPHEFWLVTGQRTNRSEIRDEATMHLMASVWDRETGFVAPSVSPSITIFRDDEQVGSLTPWSMLSQPMGLHYGDNVAISGSGEYRFEVSVNGATEELSGGLGDVFQSDSVTITNSFDPETIGSLGTISAENSGEPGAISPMQMEMITITQQLSYSDSALPFTEPQQGSDIRTAVALAPSSDVDAFTDSDQALLVAPQTRYNRFPVPLMGVDVTVTRDGSTVFDGELSPGIHPDVGHYYGAGVSDIQSGDEITVSYTTPPQFARHVGYEVAFFELEDQTFTL